MNPIRELASVGGFKLATTNAGISKHDRDDLVIMDFPEASTVAAVFTSNIFSAAPVIVARDHLSKTSPRFLLVNAGNANAGTGDQGVKDTIACCKILADLAGCETEKVLPFSTGVIGEPLPVAKFEQALPDAYNALDESHWEGAAVGIMTTDTFPKAFSRKIEIGDEIITITGIAKGAGMIRPDMATMLAYIATDIGATKEILDQCLKSAVDISFNRITVDGDTSTNDACILVATGQSGVNIDNPESTEYSIFSAAITEICQDLALSIIRDGEGATKLITISVEEGKNESECLMVAYTIAHSPLVKTAFFASDPNWGRILAAVGRSGIKDLDIDSVELYLGDVCLVKNGGRDPSYSEQAGQDVMNEKEITIRVLLGRGDSQANVWTCDLSYDYVRINAEYRT